MKKGIITILLSCTFFFAQSQTLTDSLKAHFTFDQVLEDETPFHNDLMLNYGNLNYTLNPYGDSVLVLDGNTQIKSINNFDNTNYSEICISLWFKTPVITANNQVVLQGAFTGFGVFIGANTGKIMGFFDSSSMGALESSADLTDNQWHHVLIQSDGTTSYMYIDGQLDASLQEPFYKGNGNLYFGISNLNLLPFTGELNDVKIYNRTLKDNEIKELSLMTSNTQAIISFPKFELYPNPTAETLTFEPQGNYDFVIYNTLGKMLKQGNGNDIDIRDLAAGVYYIRINNIVTKQFVKVERP